MNCTRLIAAVAAVVAMAVAGGTTEASKKKSPKPLKNMRVYPVECSEVQEPLVNLVEERGFVVVDEDEQADGDIEIEFGRAFQMSGGKSRAFVRMNVGDGECTVQVKLQNHNFMTGQWQNANWNEKKFFAPLDAMFLPK